MMVNVAAIFDEVFGVDPKNQTFPAKRCVRCFGVSGLPKSLKSHEIANTPEAEKNTPQNQGVSEHGERCAQDIVEYQEVARKDTPAHRTHRKNTNVEIGADPDSFTERAAIIEEGDGCSRDEAETRAAQEQGYAAADDLHGEVVARWAAEINRLSKLNAVSQDGTEALKRAKAFIAEGWAIQAIRLGWSECELFGVCPRAPWARLDRKGIAFCGAVQAITEDAVTYIGGLRGYRAQVNNDNGAVPIWELAGGFEQ